MKVRCWVLGTEGCSHHKTFRVTHCSTIYSDVGTQRVERWGAWALELRWMVRLFPIIVILLGTTVYHLQEGKTW